MTARPFSRIALALLLCAGAGYAVHWSIGEWQYRALLADRALSAGARGVSVKAELACPEPTETLAFVIFGQSNAANHGAVRLMAPDDVFDFYNQQCFSGNDPQFSATSDGGSPWPAFAETLREDNEMRPILWANVAVGNTRADEWTPGTPNAARLRAETAALRAKGYQIAAFLYFQGESDRETGGADYLSLLSEIAAMTDEAAPGTPFILSNSSVCGADTKAVLALSKARATLAKSHSHVHVGPDTDAIGQEFRSDGCHLNEAGLRAAGRQWAEHVGTIIQAGN